MMLFIIRKWCFSFPLLFIFTFLERKDVFIYIQNTHKYTPLKRQKNRRKG